MIKTVSEQVANENRVINAFKRPKKFPKLLKVTKQLDSKGKKLKPLGRVKTRKTCIQWTGERLKKLFSVTALHGYTHIIRKDTPLWERIIWAIIVIAAIIGATILLWMSWNWNSETPTVTVIESTHFATWNIAFPAVTICNINKISAGAANEKAKAMKRPENVTQEQLSAMFGLLIHFEGIGNATDEEYNLLHSILDLNSISVTNLMDELAPKCSEMMERCMWKGTQTRCDTLFQPIKCAEGSCCTFNYYAMKDTNLTKATHNIPAEPRRVTACGYQTGLSVLLRTQINDYHTSILGTYGFRIMVHNSFDFPDNNAETKIISAKLEAFISVNPESTYSTEDIFSLTPETRNCIDNREIKLNVMSNYSYVNCLAECRSNLIYKLCGCIPYNLPNNGSMTSCEMRHIRCIINNKELYLGAMPGLKQSETAKSVNKNNHSCGCLPECQFTQYPGEVSAGELNRNYAFNSLSFFKDVQLTDQTLLHVFFNDLVSTYYRRDIYQNWLGILATFGGILGLFLGFSFVTGFELIYFFTIRVFFDYIATKRK